MSCIITAKKAKTESPPPLKGTKRYKKLQNKIKRDKLKAERRNVYHLLEELEAKRKNFETRLNK